MMNAVFGKTMENIRNRVNIELVNGENCERFKKLTAKHNYHHNTIFSPDLVAVHMKKLKLVYDKPIYLGVSILDISKTTMLLDYYEHFKKKYGKKVRMLYTDTDSFILEIETEDLYEDMAKDADTMYDFSEYPPNHPLYSEKNRNVLGMFKDELKGDIMTEFVSVGAKTYCCKKLTLKREEETKENPNSKAILDENGKFIYEDKGNKAEIERCKGVKKSVIKNEMKFKTYKDCLDTGKDYYTNMGGIRNYLHQLNTVMINKRALSFEDDKRYILLDGSYDTLARGHHRIPELTEEERKMYEAQGARPKTY